MDTKPSVHNVGAHGARAPAGRRAGLRLEYLDGLRAVASLYVVLFHAGLGFSAPFSALPPWIRNLQRALSFGHDAVAVFIVLSGYCLMLPVARAEGHLTRGVPSYFARRAWRILPPYFATLLGTLSLLALVPILATPTTTIWDDTSPAFATGSVVSHLLLVHNFFPAWAHRINGPLWSVATEWQIYFFFPFFLLPLWRRFGALLTLLAGFALGSSLIWIAPGSAHSVNSWYLGLFALGMCAAGIGFASREQERTLRERAPWLPITLALLGAVGIGITVFIKRWFTVMPLSDSLVGATTASALVCLTRYALRPEGEPRPLLLRAFEYGPLVLLGRFSYSLYLTHLPIVALCYFGLRRYALSPAAQWLWLLLLSVPLSLLFSYGFFWVFERRFVGSPPALFG
ncbi:MAG: acyltransferase, partial [Polyangiaceae bacterium]